MSLPTDIRLLAVEEALTTVAYRAPIKFGGRVVTDAAILDVTVEVETRDKRRARGFGSMPLGNVWAWPSKTLAPAQTLSAMQALAVELLADARRCDLAGHPLELTHVLAQAHHQLAGEVRARQGLPEPIPRLAQRVAASPLEAAIHDAYGRVHGRNSYNTLGAEWANFDLAHFLTPEFRGEYLDRYTLRAPKPRIPLYHLVGALDPLDAADIATPVGDGLPETLAEWIAADGLTHLKIKLAGNQLDWDLNRVIAVERVAAAVRRVRPGPPWVYSLDFNEQCPSVDYVLDFLKQLEQQSAAAFHRVQYIEQPTHRDLRAFPENRMDRASRIKPVVIDESLVDLESLQDARSMGYTGVALKACKGHSEALLMGAAAQKYGMFLCVQDLTCPGRSFLHSASLAARIPTVAAIEGNGRQYCPSGNAAWADRSPGMFQLTDGTLETSLLDGIGLGF